MSQDCRSFALSDLGSQLDDAPGVAVEYLEEHFLRDLVMDGCLGKLVPNWKDFFRPEPGYFAIERVPAVSGASGGAAGSGDATRRVVE